MSLEQKEEETEAGRGTGDGAHEPLAQEGGLHLDICVRVHEFLITPLFTGLVCLLSQGRFKEPPEHFIFLSEIWFCLGRALKL